MKKTVCGLLLVLLFVGMSGCSNSHTHQWADANYQSPSTCSVCGETKGLALTADFDKYGILINMEAGEEYAYTTITQEEGLETTGRAVISDYHTVASDETHEAKKGYEWKIVTLKLTMGDANSNTYGFNYNYVIADYYDLEGFTQSYTYDAANQVNTFTVNYNGTDYTDCLLKTTVSSDEWYSALTDGIYTKTVTLTFAFQLPAGYDGMVVGLRNSKVGTTDQYYLFQYYNQQDFLLFRLG